MSEFFYEIYLHITSLTALREHSRQLLGDKILFEFITSIVTICTVQVSSFLFSFNNEFIQ